MKDQKFSHQITALESINLLKRLNAIERERRESIAWNLHETKSSITALKYSSHLHEVNLKQAKQIFPELEEDRKIIDDLIVRMRHTTQNVYPQLIKQYGLLNGLTDYVLAKKNFMSEIEFNNFTLSSIDLEKYSQVGIYLLSIEIIEYLLLKSDYKIELNVFGDNAELFIEFIQPRKNRKNLKDPNKEIYNQTSEKLIVIKARLICEDASVDTDTNWEDYIKIGFTL